MSTTSVRKVTMLFVLAVAVLASAVSAQQLSVVSWNLESGDADPQTLRQFVAETQGVDIWGFSEMEAAWADTLEDASEEGEDAHFETVLGTTGRGDRLAVVYDEDRFDLLSTEELDDLNPGGRVRSPLVVELFDNTTRRKFLFMVNHLYRSNEGARHEQAEGLNIWARGQDLPIIAVGDYNFDWEVEGGDDDHDRGYDEMTKDGIFAWVRPATLVKTQASPRYNSVLDFVFVADKEQEWDAVSEIELMREPFTDDDSTSDHRPVKALFTIPGAPPVVERDLKDELLERLELIQRQLDELRRDIEEGM